MQQLQIQYFFPLTEQIPLDLDFTPSEEYQESLRRKLFENSVLISNGNIGIGSYATTSNVSFQTNSQERMRIDAEGIFHIAPNTSKVGYWEITKDFFVYRESKPNVLIRAMTQFAFGWKWKSK
jgi:hypothetical protein